MNKKKIIIIALATAVLLACVGAAVLLVLRPGNNGDDPGATIGTNPEGTITSTDPTENLTDATLPEEATTPAQADTTSPATPGGPANPVTPGGLTTPTPSGSSTNPTTPGGSTAQTTPADPSMPIGPDVTVPNTEPLMKAQIRVTCEDGSVAQGAAVIATDSDGRQEYESTDSNGVAEVYLPKGKYSLQVMRDGQYGNTELEISDRPVEKKVSLKDERVLYILVGTSGSYEGEPGELTGFSTLVDGIAAKYPKAVYITSENRHDVKFRDGDALLSVKVLIEQYTANDQFFAGEVKIDFTAYQESVTAWDMDEGGEEINTEFIDGNVCSLRVRNNYDYEYRDAVSMVTESYYSVQTDLHLSKYSIYADSWSYGYTLQNVRSTSTEQRPKAPGAGKEMEAFWYDVNEMRFRDYLTYAQQVFPYVDLWMAGNWNEGIEQLVSAQ